MKIREIVEVILRGDIFAGNNGRPKGYLGVVDGATMAIHTMRSDDIMAADHSGLGRSPFLYRWRYATNRITPTVLWTTNPEGEPEVKAAVEDWLDRRGYRVMGHTIDASAWMGY